MFLTLLVPGAGDEEGGEGEGNKYVGAVVALSMLGKLAITSSYGVVYIFSTEQFPTEVIALFFSDNNIAELRLVFQVRNVALGGCSMSARIGGILCPYVNLLKDFWR